MGPATGGLQNKVVHEIVLRPEVLTDGRQILYRDDGTEFMCSHFDYFGEASHHDSPLVTEECRERREILRRAMQKQGFQEYKNEWWHYSLIGEPFPSTYFDFDVVE
ncbi:unnamed protein product [Sphagnum balticum]